LGELSTSNARRAASSRPALRRCIAVDPDAFAAQYWSRSPLLTTREELGEDYSDLLSLDAIDELLSRRGLRTPFLRVAKDGKVVDTNRFTRSGGAGAEIGDQLADDKLLGLFLDGSTLVLQGLHRAWPPLMAFATQLAEDLGYPVQVNAYITPPQSQGFSAHYDVHDVFVLQIAGEKRWFIHEPVLEAPLRSQPWNDRATAVAEAATGNPVIDTVLRAGDALYLPRGYLHSAKALGGVSAHLTVGVHPVTRYALVEAMLGLAAADPSLRTSLPLGVDLADPKSMASDLEATVSALQAWLSEADTDEVIARVRRHAWGATRPAPVAPLAQAAATRELDSATRVQLRGQLRVAVEETAGDNDVRVNFGDRSLTLPASTRQAIDAVLSGTVLAAGALPGLNEEDSLVLCRRLLREAVVVPVPVIETDV
jgi:bifunctional lysine-specific demethylase and histidyl-hydroxylase NO66